VKDYLFASVVVRRQWAPEHRDTLVRALRALAKGTDWVYDPANKEAATEIVRQVAGLSEKGARAAYQKYVAEGKAYPGKANVNKEGLLKVMQFMRNPVLRPPRRFRSHTLT
jgi:ABC-type nitrate/sulfonate/bicarbonate transport system substrate-binding protein